MQVNMNVREAIARPSRYFKRRYGRETGRSRVVLNILYGSLQ